MPKYTVADFFSKKVEIDSSEILHTNKDLFSEAVMTDYVLQVTRYPLCDYISYIKQNPIDKEITSRDITQLSSIEDCTFNMCQIMTEFGINGLTLSEIATYLHADGKYKDNMVALTKYGENHVKTAMQFGLTLLKKDLWYPSSIGKVFCSLPEDVRHKYLCLALFRDPFYSRLIVSLLERDTNIRSYMAVLSESTQARRSSSCIRVLKYFFAQCSIENIFVYNINS